MEGWNRWTSIAKANVEAIEAINGLGGVWPACDRLYSDCGNGSGGISRPFWMPERSRALSENLPNGESALGLG